MPHAEVSVDTSGFVTLRVNAQVVYQEHHPDSVPDYRKFGSLWERKMAEEYEKFGSPLEPAPRDAFGYDPKGKDRSHWDPQFTDGGRPTPTLPS